MDEEGRRRGRINLDVIAQMDPDTSDRAVAEGFLCPSACGKTVVFWDERDPIRGSTQDGREGQWEQRSQARAKSLGASGIATTLGRTAGPQSDKVELTVEHQDGCFVVTSATSLRDGETLPWGRNPRARVESINKRTSEELDQHGMWNELARDRGVVVLSTGRGIDWQNPHGPLTKEEKAQVMRDSNDTRPGRSYFKVAYMKYFGGEAKNAYFAHTDAMRSLGIIPDCLKHVVLVTPEKPQEGFRPLAMEEESLKVVEGPPARRMGQKRAALPLGAVYASENAGFATGRDGVGIVVYTDALVQEEVQERSLDHGAVPFDLEKWFNTIQLVIVDAMDLARNVPEETRRITVETHCRWNDYLSSIENIKTLIKYLFYSYSPQTNLFDDYLDEHPKHSLRVLTIVDQLLHLFVQESQLLHIQNPHDHESIHQSHDYQ